MVNYQSCSCLAGRVVIDGPLAANQRATRNPADLDSGA